MSIDLTALPEDVETLQRMITDLVRERDSARAEAEAEIARLTRIHQAPAPERPVAKSLATPALLSQVLISKYCDHLPLYRQSRIFARQGVTLNRSTLANWVAGAAWWLAPIRDRIADHVMAGDRFADRAGGPAPDCGPLCDRSRNPG